MPAVNPSRPLSAYKVLIFDVYGTLVDWETGIYDALRPILPAGWTRAAALEAYTSVEKDLQAQHPELPYRDLLAKAHEVLSACFNALVGGGERALDGSAGTANDGVVTAATSTSVTTISAAKPDPHARKPKFQG